MQEIINILYNENYNGVRDTINNNRNIDVDIQLLFDNINNRSKFNSHLIYLFLYLLTDKCGTCDNILNSLGKESKYNNNWREILLEYNKLSNISISNFDKAIEQIEDYELHYGWSLNGKYLFPCGIIYPLLAISRMMNSAIHVNHFQNEIDRYRHIIENQIFIIEENAINGFYLSSILDINNEYNKNIFIGDVFSYKYNLYRNNIIFDAAIGEPVTHDGMKKRSYNYVYHNYIKKYISISKITCMLTPSRWFQTESGDFKYLIKFREFIINSDKVRLLNYFEILSDPEYTGGLSYIIFDREYKGECLFKKQGIYVDLKLSDLILKNANYYNILRKINTGKYLSSIYISSGWANIKTNDKRLLDKETQGTIKVYVSDRKGRNKWLSIDHIKNKEPKGLFQWKVFTPETVKNGFSKFITAKPCEVCNQTYCGFIVNSEQQANSLISFLKTNFANKILLFGKIKNHINLTSVKNLPYVPLDRKWDDCKVIEYFKLNSQEKNIIYG